MAADSPCRLELMPDKDCFFDRIALCAFCICLIGRLAICTARVAIDSKSAENVLTPVKRSGVMADISIGLSPSTLGM